MAERFYYEQMGSKATRKESDNSNLVTKNIYAIVVKLLEFLKENKGDEGFAVLFGDISTCKNIDHYLNLLERVLVARNLPNINELRVAINALRAFRTYASHSVYGRIRGMMINGVMSHCTVLSNALN